MAGLDVCFVNPGTTELSLLKALDRSSQIRPVLGLFEGVLTGAADGYARMSKKPAMTLTHMGPSFANGLANLHNARRAGSPVINIVGDQPTWHHSINSGLNSEIELLAKYASTWVRVSQKAMHLSSDMTKAISVSIGPPGQIVTLIVPADCQWGIGKEIAPIAANRKKQCPRPIKSPNLGRISSALKNRGKTMLLLGGQALESRGLNAAGMIAKATGCRLMCESFPARLEQGPNYPSLQRLPYVPDFAGNCFNNITTVILAGLSEPVPFFGYPDDVRHIIPKFTKLEVLTEANADVVEALETLASELGATPQNKLSATPNRPQRPSGKLTKRTLLEALASIQPERMICVDEGISVGGAYLAVSKGCPDYTYLSLTGGACGQGLPSAIGAAIACPDRKVLALVGDGSAMYTVQALWTQARESLNIVNLICANQSYRTLQFELMRMGDGYISRNCKRITELKPPPIRWVDVSKGMGIPAVQVSEASELTASLERAFSEPGPHLIEAVL